MPNIRTYDAGDIGLRPTETGVEARAGTARRVGMFYNQQASATEMLERETDRLAGETGKLAGETGRLGSQTSQFGREVEGLADYKAHLGNIESRAIASTVDTAGRQAEKIVDHQQIVAGAPAFAKLMQAKEQQWNDKIKTADPNDPTTGKKFLDGNLEPDLQKFSEGFYTEGARHWAESQINAFRQHMYTKTSADMSTAAGQAAVVGQHQTINSLSATVRSDPSSLDFSLATLDHATEGVLASSPNLSAADAAKARGAILQKGKEEIIKSAALGHIEKTGQVPDWASDPKYSPYINGAELKQFSQSAKYYQRLGEAEGRAARVQREHKQKLDFNDKINQLEAATMPKNVGDKPTLPADYYDQLRTLATHPGAPQEPGRLRTMVQQGEIITDRLNKPEPLGRVSHETTMDLLGRIRATDDTRLTDNGAIYEAYKANKLSTADFNFLNREFTSLRSPEGVALEKDRAQFTKTFSKIIDGGMSEKGGPSLLGTQRLYEFEMDARRQEEVLRKAGKDPHQVYDPRSEYYWGKPENIAKYHVSMDEALKYDKTLKAMDKVSTDQGGRLTGMQVIDQPAGAKTFVPPNDWQWSPSRQQYRDKNGAIYDVSGNRAK